MNYEVLSRNAKYSLIEQILINRGIAPEDVEHYLHTTAQDILDPKLIKNIESAAKILIRTIANEANAMI